ncbi:GNAT family N-acetyltransferase [Colwelliaceae bacterium 6441]
MTHPEICLWFERLNQRLSKARHRSLVILHGDYSWGRLTSAQVVNYFQNKSDSFPPLRTIIWGDNKNVEGNDEHIHLVKNYRHHLGSENDFVIFADNDFHPDAFAALSGTLVAGGIFVWVCPPELVINHDDNFMQRLWQKALQNDRVYILSQSHEVFPTLPCCEPSIADVFVTALLEHDCITEDQKNAVAAIEKVASGHRKRPLILTADRGRGKSSALAIAVANRLLSTTVIEPQTIIITAPHLDALKVFFHQLKASCPEGEFHRGAFSLKAHRVGFFPVDKLLTEKPEASLLLVDEAAAIPVYLLSKFVDQYHRIVFSSTQHGYEGAGRGFAIKFKQILQRKTPNFNHLSIHQPIRWAENDPLESFVFDGFLFNSIDETLYSRQHHVDKTLDHDSLSFKLLEQTLLVENECMLQQIFSVLVTAHYQTSPSDLKLLLNNNSVRLFVIENHGQVIAVALTLIEGHVAKESVRDVAQAKRRLKNQFLPQSLFLHNHCSKAFDYQYLRVMRIAVLPSLQQQGVGTLLLENITQYALHQGIDMLGTSFGANESLLKFWNKANYTLIRLGFTTDKASGEHSALCLLPVSSEAKTLVHQLSSEFYRSFLYLLTEQYQHLTTDLIACVIEYWPDELLPTLTVHDEQVIDNFINKQSVFDACVYSLHLKLIYALRDDSFRCTVDKRTKAVLIQRLLQRQTTEDLCHKYALAGKKALNQLLIDSVKLFKK